MIKIKSFSFPVHVSLNVTAKCNLRCSHCSGDYGNFRCNEMDWNGWKKVIDYLKYAKVFTVNLTGGEPTQSPYFFDILNELRKNKIFVTLSSNLFFDDSILKKIISYKDIIRNIKTSIDGYNEEINGLIRHSRNHEGVFETIIRNYNNLKSNGFNLTVSTVLHKQLINDFQEMVRFIIELKPNNWVVTPIVKVGRASKNSKEIIPDFDKLMTPNYEEIETRLNSNGIAFSQVDFPSIKKKDPYGCPACNESVIINYDGTMAPCQLGLEILPHYGYVFPNLLSTKFEDVWKCDAFEKFRLAQKHGCVDCEINSLCKRCVPQSLKYFNDELAPTPYCVSVADFLGMKNYAYWENRLKISDLEDCDEQINS